MHIVNIYICGSTSIVVHAIHFKNVAKDSYSITAKMKENLLAIAVLQQKILVSASIYDILRMRSNVI